MILFKNISEDKKTLWFESTEDQEVIVKIIDNYTKLCTYKLQMDVVPKVSYYFSHLADSQSRYFEIWDQKEQNLLLKVGAFNNQINDIKNEDKYNLLKDFNDKNKVDISVSIGLYEIFVTKIYDKFFSINKEDIVFDIGGNVGFFSYYSICKGASKVYCFEPSPSDCNIIRNNFNFDNLTLEEAAVSSNNGYVDLYFDKNHSIAASIYEVNKELNPNESEKIKCKSINLNDYIKENNITKIDYLKIDCEGAEYDIIESLDKDYLTNNVNKICLEYHFNKGQLVTLINKLKECNFKINFEFGDHQINDELGIIYAYK